MYGWVWPHYDANCKTAALSWSISPSKSTMHLLAMIPIKHSLESHIHVAQKLEVLHRHMKCMAALARGHHQRNGHNYMLLLNFRVVNSGRFFGCKVRLSICITCSFKNKSNLNCHSSFRMMHFINMWFRRETSLIWSHFENESDSQRERKNGGLKFSFSSAKDKNDQIYNVHFWSSFCQLRSLESSLHWQWPQSQT